MSISTTVLTIRPGALGDTLLALPALRALRARFAGARLHLVGHRDAGALLRAAGEVDACTDFDAPELAELFLPGQSPRWLERLGPIEAAVAWLADPEGSVEAHLRHLGAERVLVAPSRPAPGLGQHTADHLLASLAPWSVAAPEARPLVLPDRSKGMGEQPCTVRGRAGRGRPAYLQGIPGGRGEDAPPPGHAPSASPEIGGPSSARPSGHTLSEAEAAPQAEVLVHPGSGSAAKNWPPESFARVLDSLNQAQPGLAALLSGPADEAACAAVLRHTASPPPVVRPASVLELGQTLARVQVYLGNDSGVSHLAAVLDVPTVVLFGPTDPRTWAPRGPWVRVLAFDSTPAQVAYAVKNSWELLGTPGNS